MKNLWSLIVFSVLSISNFSHAQLVENFESTFNLLVSEDAANSDYYLTLEKKVISESDHDHAVQEPTLSQALNKHTSLMYDLDEYSTVTDIRAKLSITLETVLDHLFMYEYLPFYCYSLVDFEDSWEDSNDGCKAKTAELLAPLFEHGTTNYGAIMIYTEGESWGSFRSLSLFFPTSEERNDEETMTHYDQISFDILHEI